VREDRYPGGRYPEWQVLTGPGKHTPAPGRLRERVQRARGGSRWHWLLWIPVVLAMMVPMYNRVDPTLVGIPFFYWWQLFLAGVCSLVITVVHLATRDRK
jgi:hypothetical protein